MDKLRRNSVRIVLVSILTTLSVMWVVSRSQVRAMEKELYAYGEELAKDFTQGKEGGETLEVAMPIVTVSKEYILFGKTIGKVALYMRHVDAGESDEHEGEAVAADKGHQHDHADGIGGVEYFLERIGSKWTQVESGQCSSEQCRTEGKRAFEAGSRLPDAQ